MSICLNIFLYNREGFVISLYPLYNCPVFSLDQKNTFTSRSAALKVGYERPPNLTGNRAFDELKKGLCFSFSEKHSPFIVPYA